MEREKNQSSSRGLEKRIGFGILLVLAGGLWLLSNFNLIPYEIRNYIFTWKMLLIGIGVISLVTNEHKIPGLILIAIGSFFLLPDIFDLSYSFRKLFWPVFLVFVGLVVIFRSRGHEGQIFGKRETNLSDDHIDEVNIFGGGDRRITTQNFKGGRITNVFGGSNLDFSDANLAPGTHVIDVFSMFGGSKYIFPSSWDVKTDVVSIFGGFSDKRKNVVTSNGEEKRVVIKGMVIFGGGEIKSY